jgi:WD40 repeat protein
MSLRKGLLALALLFVLGEPLRPAPPAKTDQYGDPLPEGALARLGTVRLRHQHVHQVLFAADGKSLYSLGGDYTIRHWDAGSGRELRRIYGVEEGWSLGGPLTLSPDGKTLATGGRSNVVYFFDARTLATRRRLRGEGGLAVGRVAFAPDGKQLAGNSGNIRVIRWDLATSRLMQPVLEGGAGHLAWSPDGKILFGDVYRWDLTTGKRSHWWPRDATRLLLAPDGRTLATGHRDHTIHLWGAATKKELHCLRGHKEAVEVLAFSADSKLLASACWAPPIPPGNTSVRLWEATSGKLLRTLEGHRSRLVSLSFSTDGKTLAAAADDARLLLWDVGTGKELHPKKPFQRISKVTFSPDGRTLATVGDGPVRLWEPDKGRQRDALAVPSRSTHALAYSADGRWLATAGGDGGVRLWDAAAGKEVRRVGKPGVALACVAFAPDNRLAAGGPGVWVWDPATGKELARFGQENAPPLCLAFSPDGKLLAAGDYRHTITFWDVATGKVVRQAGWKFQSPASAIRGIAFSPDGTMLASAGGHAKANLLLWDVQTGKWLRSFTGHTFTDVVAFSPDGKMLATGSSGSWEDTVRLWEVETGRERQRFRANPGEVSCVAFAPDGRRLATAHEDGTALVWEVMPPPGQGEKPTALTKGQLRALWSDLGSADAARGWQALRSLVGAPKAVVPFLDEQLRSLPALYRRVNRLVADLDADRFTVRQKATEELQRLGRMVEDPLRRALAGRPSLEARRRMEAVLKEIEKRAGEVTHPARLSGLRAVEALEHIGNREGRAVLRRLAEGAGKSELARAAKASLERLRLHHGP